MSMGRGHQLGGGLGDDLQRRLDIVAMALLDVGDQLPATDLVCDGDGGEGGEDDGDLLALQLLQDQLQMAQLPGVAALGAGATVSFRQSAAQEMGVLTTLATPPLTISE